MRESKDIPATVVIKAVALCLLLVAALGGCTPSRVGTPPVLSTQTALYAQGAALSLASNVATAQVLELLYKERPERVGVYIAYLRERIGELEQEAQSARPSAQRVLAIVTRIGTDLAIETANLERGQDLLIQAAVAEFTPLLTSIIMATGDTESKAAAQDVVFYTDALVRGMRSGMNYFEASYKYGQKRNSRESEKK